MTELKTPYLDREIRIIKNKIASNQNYPYLQMYLDEYQSIKEALKELEEAKARVQELKGVAKASLDHLRAGMSGTAFNTLKTVLDND